jgi:hypothetical protein
MKPFGEQADVDTTTSAAKRYRHEANQHPSQSEKNVHCKINDSLRVQWFRGGEARSRVTASPSIDAVMHDPRSSRLGGNASQLEGVRQPKLTGTKIKLFCETVLCWSGMA